ncbi:hypothetical protein U1Q18_010764 [Sarracenia purpurea var. burkii]
MFDVQCSTNLLRSPSISMLGDFQSELDHLRSESIPVHECWCSGLLVHDDRSSMAGATTPELRLLRNSSVRRQLNRSRNPQSNVDQVRIQIG